MGAVKKAKVERWEKSVGKLGGGGALSSLVVRRKPAAAPPAGCISKPGDHGTHGALQYLFTAASHINDKKHA